MLPANKPEHDEEDKELIELEPDGSEDPGSQLDRDATVPLLDPASSDQTGR